MFLSYSIFSSDHFALFGSHLDVCWHTLMRRAHDTRKNPVTVTVPGFFVFALLPKPSP
jgi:hypothetical protein